MDYLILLIFIDLKRNKNEHDTFLKNKLIIRKRDQNMAFWDLEQYFGEFDTILDLSNSQRNKYRQKFGDEALSQGYLYAKVNYLSFSEI